ncbi:MAG: hypothetical protein EOO61_17910, partial [Hymenobacter sp.]
MFMSQSAAILQDYGLKQQAKQINPDRIFLPVKKILFVLELIIVTLAVGLSFRGAKSKKNFASVLPFISYIIDMFTIVTAALFQVATLFGNTGHNTASIGNSGWGGDVARIGNSGWGG